jgi:hypothetical protein
LELYKNSIEINKNYYYLLFLKKEKQNLTNAGPLPLFSPGSAQLAQPRKTRQRSLFARAHSLSLSLSR